MTQDDPARPQSEPSARRSGSHLVWPAVVVVIAIVAGVVSIQTCRTVSDGQRAAAHAVDQLGEGAAAIADRLRSGHITTTFIAAIPRLAPDSGPSLELGVFEATEVFARSDDRRVLFDLVPLGTTVSEIRVPVTYRYHLRFDEPWRLEVREHSCIVNAPPIRPSLPPAIHTDRMEKRSSSGWLRFDADDQMANLERSITPTLADRAADPDHLELVRERCRTHVAEFVRSWLLVEDHWRPDRFRSISVRFADEAEPAHRTIPPTLVLDERVDGE